MTSTSTQTGPKSTTKALLTCGVVAGPLFIATVVIQALTREGFDPKKHPLSLLALGDLGWIQTTNFILSGLLAFASAFGLRQILRGSRGGMWGPILIAIYGIGLVWGGVFAADPAFGYPVGTPDGAPDEISWHGILHAIAPAAAAIALIAACFVFARRFFAQGQRGWAIYCIVTAVLDLVLTGASFSLADYRVMLLGGAVIWIWAAVVTYKLMDEHRAQLA